MILKILVTVTAILALAPNLLIGYLYLNKDKIIEQQKEALIKSISGQLTDQLGKQTEALTGNMDSMFTDKVQPEMQRQHQYSLMHYPRRLDPLSRWGDASYT